MKQCTICKIEKEESGFDLLSSNKLRSCCKECRRECIRQHYNENKSYYIEKAAKRKPDERQRYIDYKSKLSCHDCGLSFEKEPYLCDFHHLDGDDKLNHPSLLSRSWKKFLAEVIKCIPLCPTCHRRRHYAPVV